MNVIHISGASDDLIHIGENDEFDSFCGRDTFTFTLDGVDVLTMIPHYNGAWSFSFTPVEEYDFICWPEDVTITHEWGTMCYYSATVSLWYPTASVMTWRMNDRT